ncbi:hypothetical protein RRG08_010650 [Elysia crispata]|uniref:Uncharacterized protein n=1 Tax=Elysia crispata TaxID=231223 RepID=A0AAE0Z2H3_9GAST|nr:hypothetical protein RRG08_010650 [Elysia crispata]
MSRGSRGGLRNHQVLLENVKTRPFNTAVLKRLSERFTGVCATCVQGPPSYSQRCSAISLTHERVNET